MFIINDKILNMEIYEVMRVLPQTHCVNNLLQNNEDAGFVSNLTNSSSRP